MATKQRLQPWQNGHFGSKIKNAKKHAKNVSTRHCSCSMQKTARKKQLIFEKREHFENWQKWSKGILKKQLNWQKWPPSKGYSLGKMVTLGQKLKMQKNMLKTFLQDIAVVLCKKRLEKTANIRKMRAF